MTMDPVVGLPEATIGRRLWRQQGTSRTCARRLACRIEYPVKVEDGVVYIDTEGVSPLFASP